VKISAALWLGRTFHLSPELIVDRKFIGADDICLATQDRTFTGALSLLPSVGR